MPAAAVQNPPVQGESKSAKKKKAKAERADSPAPSASPTAEKAGSTTGQEQEDGFESPYIRDLQKNIRNLTKKIANAAKTDPIVDQHKGKSLDELVADKILNPDQKAQRLKKPQLEAQLASAEEQLAQYKKVYEEYRSRGAADKAGLEKSLTEKLEKEKAEAVADAQEKAAAETKKLQHDSLLILSQFLRLAAARRSEDADSTLDENMALEGVLLNVYSGDENAVAHMTKLIEGSDEKTRSVNGDELQTTFGQVKAAAMAYISPFASAEAAPEATEVPESHETIASDPTIAHAGLTELDTTDTTIAMTNGHTESRPASALPANVDVSDNAANAVAEAQWDTNNDLSGSITQEDWVQVPRDPTETESGLTATPAAAGNVQSWADDQPEHTSEQQVPVPTEANDGFHQVQRTRTRGHEREGSNSWRGRGRGGGRGGYEGRGGRGRGRGRGGMGMRGRPRTEES